MVTSNSILAQLMSAPMRAGRVTWIGLRPARRASLDVVDAVEARADVGLVGDRYAGREGKRQVTLIQAEDLTAIASYLGMAQVAPEWLRRNIVTEGINLLALKGKCFKVGGAILEYTGACHPCSRMEEVLGQGGYNAVRGHGGITARVIGSGKISRDDSITVVD